METFDALVAERGDTSKIWASMLKEAIKRRKPDFSEGAFGFRSFGNLLEDAQAKGAVDWARRNRGAFVSRGASPVGRSEAVVPVSEAVVQVAAISLRPLNRESRQWPRRRPGAAKRRSRGGKRKANEAAGGVLLNAAPAVAVTPSRSAHRRWRRKLSRKPSSL